MTEDPVPDVLARLDEHDMRLDSHGMRLDKHEIQLDRLTTSYANLQASIQAVSHQLAESRGEERERAKSQRDRDAALYGQFERLEEKIDNLFDATSRERGAREERQRLFNRNTTWGLLALAALGTLLGWQEFGQTIWHSILHLQEPS